MAISVQKAGFSTTVQDLGRPGYYDVGIPMSGAMNRYALRIANLLVGNDEGDAGLECVFTGPELRLQHAASIAVTGADLRPKLDGEPRPTWTAFPAMAGQVLSFDYLRSGARAYIAVSGGVEVPVVLGSRSTYLLGALGGLEGRKLKLGDELSIGPSRLKPSETTLPETLRRGVQPPPGLRIITGLYAHRITPAGLHGFLEDVWTVAAEADRIGYRFRGGRPLAFVDREQPFGAGSDPSNIVDSCYPYGSIQVPGGAEAIVLHRDAVSGGGYCTLGTVISADMDFIGQLQPNKTVAFIAVTMAEALEARRERQEMLRLSREMLRRR